MADSDQRPVESLWFKHLEDIDEVYEDERKAYSLDLSYLSLVPGSIKLNGVASLVDQQGLTKFDKRGLLRRVKQPNGSSAAAPILVTGRPEAGRAAPATSGAAVQGQGTTASGAGMDTLSQAIEELKISTEYAIPPPALDRVQKSLFALYSGEQGQMSVDDVDDDESSRYHCVGFFFGEPDKAVTADHCISEHEVGEFVDAYSPFYNRFFQMEVMQRDKKLDVAVLRRTNVTVGDDLGKTYLEKHAGMVKEGRKVALCSCSVHITMELEETNPALTVLDATVNRYSHSKQHIVYQCPTFGGDCGSALVMHDGKVLGLHVMGVNQLKERIGQKKTTKERLDALEMSMDSAIKCVAHGAIAVVLDKFA